MEGAGGGGRRARNWRKGRREVGVGRKGGKEGGREERGRGWEGVKRKSKQEFFNSWIRPYC